MTQLGFLDFSTSFSDLGSFEEARPKNGHDEDLAVDVFVFVPSLVIIVLECK